MTAITTLLVQAAAGEAAAIQQAYAALYPEIRRIARRRLADVGGVTDLNTTALIHEGFLRMAEREGLRGSQRVQFFAYVGRALRSVVLDHLRERATDKRGGALHQVTLSKADEMVDAAPLSQDLAALDDAIEKLRLLDEPLSQTVEIHFFAGLSIAEIAEVRGVSSRTVDRDLRKARLVLAELVASG